ncbi:D-cysteine desulfhydrase [Desulfuromusa kysingii]|uniref:D-cysteine desulfhydrase n=1 Tax=Desulfuromusa kysingii TaxID=37625 RepID=A0A1H3XGT8_9BACT|nr:D-cysteine desulfhydrase family protein [Desulfuromusa kysingii]SDZ97832.1 D-cysteine desulfhydrase [Desulfuromusa kysingii]
MSQSISFQYPERVQLAQTPTPLQKMERLSDRFGVDIYFKRDDYTGTELSGNKVRKLEFLLHRALQMGVDTVITCGGAQSNHCRATAFAAKRLGLKTVLLLRTPNPAQPPATEANILLDYLADATVIWITPEQYQQRNLYFARQAEQLVAAGACPYIIPEGGSNALGAWGYVSAVEELVNDVKELDASVAATTTVISAVGSGGTTAGLVLGNKLFAAGFRVVGVNVCDDREYFQRVIGTIMDDFQERYLPQSIVSPADIEILDGYVGKGYALSQPAELEAIRDLARLEGVVLDPVYTGKAYFAMISELEKNPQCFGPRIVFVHTGGLFGLFSIAEQMAAVL